VKTPHIRTRLDLKRALWQGALNLPVEITFLHDGDDTEARVSIPCLNGQEMYGEGFAFLCPGDKYDKTLGEQLALTRALIDAFEEAEDFLISKVETKQKHDPCEVPVQTPPCEDPDVEDPDCPPGCNFCAAGAPEAATSASAHTDDHVGSDDAFWARVETLLNGTRR
jgi:hypothetical protein